jgi:hypothetical protein
LPAPDTHRRLTPLHVLADLDLTVDGKPVRVEGRGDRITVDVPDTRPGSLLLKAAPSAGGPRLQALRQADRALQDAGLTAEMRVQGDVFARLGKGARPGALARFFRLGNLEVSPAPAALRVARERPALAFGVTAIVGALLAVLVTGIARRD